VDTKKGISNGKLNGKLRLSNDLVDCLGLISDHAWLIFPLFCLYKDVDFAPLFIKKKLNLYS